MSRNMDVRLAVAAIAGAVAGLGVLVLWALHKVEADLAGMRFLP